MVIINLGENDSAGVSKGTYDPEDFKNYYRQMIASLKEKMPNAKFVVMSGLLLPGRSEYTELTIKMNTALKAYCETQDYIMFVDANQMTYDGTEYRTDLFIKDGIHLNHTGQLKWRDEYIKPAIETLIETHPELASIRK